VSRINRNSVKDQVTSERPGSPEAWTLLGGPPGTRTPNLRINSPVRTCRSARWMSSELRVCVSVVPIASRCFPFLHGDETGRTLHRCCHFDSTWRPGSTPWWICAASFRAAMSRTARGLRPGDSRKCRGEADNCAADASLQDPAYVFSLLLSLEPAPYRVAPQEDVVQPQSVRGEPPTRQGLDHASSSEKPDSWRVRSSCCVTVRSGLVRVPAQIGQRRTR
jgi:hypothetical protein